MSQQFFVMFVAMKEVSKETVQLFLYLIFFSPIGEKTSFNWKTYDPWCSLRLLFSPFLLFFGTPPNSFLADLCAYWLTSDGRLEESWEYPNR